MNMDIFNGLGASMSCVCYTNYLYTASKDSEFSELSILIIFFDQEHAQVCTKSARILYINFHIL